jgi:hypothetical protein
MRAPVNAERVRRFMRELAVDSRAAGRVYLTGGAVGRAAALARQYGRYRHQELFDAIEGETYRYPAVDAPSFRRAVESTVKLQ